MEIVIAVIVWLAILVIGCAIWEPRHQERPPEIDTKVSLDKYCAAVDALWDVESCPGRSINPERTKKEMRRIIREGAPKGAGNCRK